MPARTLAILACALALGSCGYVGDPLPPALHIPQRVQDLRAVQLADRIVVEFTIPSLTTEGLPARRIGAPDLRIGASSTAFQLQVWAESAKPIHSDADRAGTVRVEVPVAEWIGKDIVIGVRARNRDRLSEWSNLETLKVVAPVVPPADVKAVSHQSGARVSWRGADPRPGIQFRIYRSEAQLPEEVVGNADSPEYVDSRATFGKSYSYRVQAVLNKALSEISPSVNLTPEDVFPPETPSGITPAAGINGIELTWKPAAAPDLKGYRVYRAEGNGDFSVLIDQIETPSFRDRQIRSGVKYRYHITSVDQADNESEHSSTIEVTAP